MNLSSSDIKEIAGYLELARTLKPVAGDVVDVILDYGPEIKRLLQAIVDGSCALRIRAVSNYREAGFTPEDSIRMALATMEQVANAIPSTETKKKRS